MARAFQTIGAAVLLVSLVLFINGASARTMLYAGQSLLANQFLVNGQNRFLMMNDCNLVFYNDTHGIWETHTSWHGITGCRLTLQHTGFLAIHSPAGNIIWNNNFRGAHARYQLVVQDNGIVAIYEDAVWATNTGPRGKLVENIALPI